MPDIPMIVLECCENMFGKLLVMAVFCFLFITSAAEYVTKQFLCVMFLIPFISGKLKEEIICVWVS